MRVAVCGADFEPIAIVQVARKSMEVLSQRRDTIIFRMVPKLEWSAPVEVQDTMTVTDAVVRVEILRFRPDTPDGYMLVCEARAFLDFITPPPIRSFRDQGSKVSFEYMLAYDQHTHHLLQLQRTIEYAACR